MPIPDSLKKDCRAGVVQADVSARRDSVQQPGEHLHQLGQFENALENARKSLELDPDSISGYTNVAAAYAGMNRLDEAKRSWLRH